MISKAYLRLALVLGVMSFALACRTADTIAKLRPPATSTRVRAVQTTTRRATNIAQVRQSPTAIVAVTDIPPPTEEPVVEQQEAPTERVPTTRIPTRRAAPAQPTQRPPDTPIPQPTTPQYAYRVKESRCGPNVRTYIEGFVYEGSVGKNGLLVRISQGPDGLPDPNDDYKTGTDPKRAGYYYQNIDSNAPHDGTWYLWVIDPNTQQRISEIAIVKTDKERVEDSGTSSGSCQSATVNFTTAPPPPTVRPTNVRPTQDPNSTPQPTPTQDNLDDS